MRQEKAPSSKRKNNPPMSNTFGRLFRFTSFGESHGPAIGVVIDGCPAGLLLDLEAMQQELDRRRPGQSAITTQRQERDRVVLLSGAVQGVTTGAPLAFIVHNEDQRPQDYEAISQVFRPSHADYTYFAKYGLADRDGGGRSSARETIARVIAGAVARQLLAPLGVRIHAHVHAIGGHSLVERPTSHDLHTDAMRLTRCPDQDKAQAMLSAIEAARDAGDSLGGVIECSATGVPAGWGQPIYDKLEARLAAAMLGINATKGFEIGSGFGGAALTGSAHNDAFHTDDEGRVRTRTNRSGGVQGGISNGEEIWCRVAFKPTSTISRLQETVTVSGEAATLAATGRHDPCVVPRAVPIVEAMCAVVLADFWLLSKGDRLHA